MLLRLLEIARIHHATFGKQEHPVKHRRDITLRLMDGEDDRSVVLLRQIGKRLDDIISVVRVETWIAKIHSARGPRMVKHGNSSHHWSAHPGTRPKDW